MKNFILALALTVTGFSQAQNEIEFDPATEVKCAQEVEKLSCQGSEAAVTRCTEANKRSLSPDCRELHETKMKNR